LAPITGILIQALLNWEPMPWEEVFEKKVELVKRKAKLKKFEFSLC